MTPPQRSRNDLLPDSATVEEIIFFDDDIVATPYVLTDLTIVANIQNQQLVGSQVKAGKEWMVEEEPVIIKLLPAEVIESIDRLI